MQVPYFELRSFDFAAVRWQDLVCNGTMLRIPGPGSSGHQVLHTRSYRIRPGESGHQEASATVQEDWGPGDSGTLLP